MVSKIAIEEVIETIDMIAFKNLNIRTVTLGINILDSSSSEPKTIAERISSKIRRVAASFQDAVKYVEDKYGVKIINRRITLTPLSLVIPPIVSRNPASSRNRWLAESLLDIALEIDDAAKEVGADLIGGYSALVHDGCTKADIALMESIPTVLSSTSRLCSSVNVADTRNGINVDAIAKMGEVILETSRLSPEGRGFACARLTVMTNAPEDNPFMAGGFHGPGQPEAKINIGISGPAVILSAIESTKEQNLTELCMLIKRIAFKISRVGELIGREIASLMNIEFGSVDLSLAPAPAPRESIANILEAIGVEKTGVPGSIAALMLLVDSVKKGGLAAVTKAGGLSGTFIPVTEDLGMVEAVSRGTLSIPTILAMTAVSATGLDMVPVPGDTPADVISSIILDQAAIGVVTGKSVGVRIIPVPNSKPGDRVDFGGLFGSGVVMEVPRIGAAKMLKRGGRIPPPITSMKN
jgi:uncharacterized protein (UPF0210 family)